MSNQPINANIVLDSPKLNKYKELLNNFYIRYIYFDHFIENNNFYKDLITSHHSIYNHVKERINNSLLNKKVLFRINLNTAKLLETNRLIISRIKQIQNFKLNPASSQTKVIDLTQTYGEIVKSLDSQSDLNEVEVKKSLVQNLNQMKKK